MSQGGNWKLNSCVITSYSGGGSISLFSYVNQIEIYEDIHKTFLSAQIDIVETEGLIERLPIKGDEYVTASFTITGINQTTAKNVSFEMDVYRLEKEIKFKHKATSFRLQLVSKSFQKDVDNRTRKYFRGTQDEIVAQLVDAQLGGELIRVDKCAFEEEYIFPNWHPSQCIKKLAKNSLSDEYNDPDYVFYEDLEGFHYVSMSYMIDPAWQVYAQTTGRFQSLIPEGVADRGSVADFNIEYIHKRFSYDNINNINYGMYGTTLITHDVAQRKWRETGADYATEFPTVLHNASTELTKLAGEHSWKNRMMLHPTNEKISKGVYNTDDYTDQKKRLVVRQMQTENNNLVLEFMADPNLKVGYAMNLKLGSIDGVNSNKEDELLSGMFLITKIRHVISRETYFQMVEISKDSYEK